MENVIIRLQEMQADRHATLLARHYAERYLEGKEKKKEKSHESHLPRRLLFPGNFHFRTFPLERSGLTRPLKNNEPGSRPK
jgi:hypothetical protein